MLGVYDFCGHYEWTFEWLRQRGGESLLQNYWDQAIHRDSQRHASQLILSKGIDGMKKYWGHTLEEEAAGYTMTAIDQVMRTDMRACPSMGFLTHNRLKQYHDYCDHCMGWVGPLMKRAGFVIDHEHNHCGQCWFEIRRKTDATPPSKPGQLAGRKDVRLAKNWRPSTQRIDQYKRATLPQHKSRQAQGPATARRPTLDA
ncbi:MAG: hypothetical protein PHV34_15785 [Verrucomicrobiae bacterium]|nr:hypothetical protein [Verrucomicrobiae bacterium]